MIQERGKDYEIWYGTSETLEPTRRPLQAEGWTVSTVQEIDREDRDAPLGATHYIWGMRPAKDERS